MTVNTERLELACAALESGKFPQRKGLLRTGGGWCCLGVMCEVYRRETGDGMWSEDPSSTALVFTCDDEAAVAYMPQSVADWYGLPTRDPDLGVGAGRHGARTASGWNDHSRRTFADIAAAFRRQYITGS